MDGIDKYRNADLHKRGVQAVCRYLELNGDEVVESGFDSIVGRIDVVSRDDAGALHLVIVHVRRYGLPLITEPNEGTRHRLEQRAIAYLDAHPDVSDVPIVFDVADVGVVGENRALLRYQRGILSTSGSVLRDRTASYEGVPTVLDDVEDIIRESIVAAEDGVDPEATAAAEELLATARRLEAEETIAEEESAD